MDTLRPSPSQPPTRTSQVEPSTNLEGPSQRRPIDDRLSLQAETSLRSSDHLNQRREKEPPQTNSKVERLRKEVETVKRNQQLTRKWVSLRAEFCEAGQDLLPHFLVGQDSERPTETEPMKSRTIFSHKSPTRKPTNPIRIGKYTHIGKTGKADSEVRESHHFISSSTD